MSANDSMKIRKRILHLLEIYVVVTPTMLQASLGSNTRPHIWKHELEALRQEGTVVMDETPPMLTPAGRWQSYKRVYLTRHIWLVDRLTQDLVATGKGVANA